MLSWKPGQKSKVKWSSQKEPLKPMTSITEISLIDWLKSATKRITNPRSTPPWYFIRPILILESTNYLLKRSWEIPMRILMNSKHPPASCCFFIRKILLHIICAILFKSWTNRFIKRPEANTITSNLLMEKFLSKKPLLWIAILKSKLFKNHLITIHRLKTLFFSKDSNLKTKVQLCSKISKNISQNFSWRNFLCKTNLISTRVLQEKSFIIRTIIMIMRPRAKLIRTFARTWSRSETTDTECSRLRAKIRESPEHRRQSWSRYVWD